MKKRGRQNRAMAFAALAAVLLIAAGLAANQASRTTMVINGEFPTGAANQPPIEGGAAIQQPNMVNVNNVSYGQVFNLGGSNVTNTTWSNYTFVNSNECGAGCDPTNGNCTVVNVSLIRISTGLIQDSMKICTGQGYPVHLPGGAYFYSYFKTVLTTEADVPASSYTVNVTAFNGTRIGRGNSAGATFVYINVWLTEGMPGVPPQWFGNQSITAYMYNPANVSNFTIAWVDNNYMGTVLLESNFSGAPQNYSMTNFTPEYYSYLNVLPAGNFYWKSYGADAEPTWNVSDVWYFAISKSNQNIANLYLNGAPNQNTAVTYGTLSNATATAIAGPKLYRNGTYVGNNDTRILPAAVYEYKTNATGNQNYTANDTGATYYLTVNPATPVVTVTLNPSSSVAYGTLTTATCAITTGDAGATLILLRNGTAVNTSTNSVSETNLLGAGVHNYTCVYQVSQNYTVGYSYNNYLTVTQTVSSCSLNINPATPITYGTATNASCSCTGTPNLYRNHSAANAEKNVNIVLPAGFWNYTCNSTASGNTTGANISQGYQVNQAGMPITLFLNGTNGNKNYLNNTLANFTITTSVSGLPVFLYTNYSNGVNKQWNNGNTPFTNMTTFTAFGVWNFTAYYAGNNNYTANTATHYAVVSKEATSITILFNGGTGTSFDTGTSINVTAVINVTGKLLYLDINVNNWTTQNGTTAVTNISTYNTAGTYNITAWFLGDTDYEAASTTVYLTISTPTPPSGGGGGGGGGGAAVPPSNVTPAPAPAPTPTPPPTVSPSVKISVLTDKLTYSSTGTAHITVTTENTGSMSLINAVIKETLTWPGGSKTFDDRMVDILPGESNVHINNVLLNGLPDKIYTYEADVIYSGNMIGKATTTFAVATPRPLVYYAVPTAALGTGLILLWRTRKPLTISKMIIPLVRGAKVSFKLTNRTKHVFKNVIVTDTVPAKIAAAGVKPKPTTSTKMPDGSMKLEWHIEHILPQEKRQFHYTLNKKKYFLPKAKIIKYERDREMEERLARKEIKKAGRGILNKLGAKQPKTVAHKPASTRLSKPAKSSAAVRKTASAKPSRPAVRKTASASPLRPTAKIARGNKKPSKPASRKAAPAKPPEPVAKTMHKKR